MKVGENITHASDVQARKELFNPLVFGKDVGRAEASNNIEEICTFK
jgi:hypothetical protein